MTDHRCRRAERCAEREKVTVTPPVCDECECHGHGPGHPCSIEGGCGHLHTETEQFLGARIVTPDGLCRVCTDHVTQALNHLPLDVAELTVLMAVTGGVGDTSKVRSTPTPPTPIKVSIEALRAEIDHELQCWAEPVAEQLGIDWDTEARHRSRLGHRVQACARLLAGAVPTLLALGEQEHPAWEDGLPVWDHDLDCQDTVTRDGVTGALHLMELHRRVFVVAGRTKLVHRLSSPCPWCGQRTLTRQNGASEVQCESDQCRGRSVPERFYDWLAAVVTAEEKRQKAVA